MEEQNLRNNNKTMQFILQIEPPEMWLGFIYQRLAELYPLGAHIFPYLNMVVTLQIALHYDTYYFHSVDYILQHINHNKLVIE